MTPTPEDLRKYAAMAKLLNETFPIPTNNDVERVALLIEKRLADKRMNTYANAAIKEGYTESIDILKNRRTNYAGIEHLKTIQGRAIAMITVDYLNGGCSENVLCGVKLKKK